MINEFDDFCLYVYVIVDTIVKPLADLLKRPGPEPVCSDSELIALSLLGECKGWDVETEMLSNRKAYRHLFPHLPTQSRFNRRRRNLMACHNLIRQTLLSQLDLSQDRQCVIDSLPIPVVQFHLVPGSTREYSADGADFGRVESKSATIFGYKLHLLITLGGLILDFELAPASAADGTVGFELLSEHTDLTVIGDKAYISAKHAAELWASNRLRLIPNESFCTFEVSSLFIHLKPLKVALRLNGANGIGRPLSKQHLSAVVARIVQGRLDVVGKIVHLISNVTNANMVEQK